MTRILGAPTVVLVQTTTDNRIHTVQLSDRHNLFAVLNDDTVVRIGPAGAWRAKATRWDFLDSARRAGHLPGVKYLAVRAIEDPDPRWRDARQAQDHEVFVGRPTKARTDYPGREVYPSVTRGSYSTGAARIWAKEHGWYGAQGGWIYTPHREAWCQGWFNLASYLTRTGKVRLIDGIWWVETSVEVSV